MNRLLTQLLTATCLIACAHEESTPPVDVETDDAAANDVRDRSDTTGPDVHDDTITVDTELPDAGTTSPITVAAAADLCALSASDDGATVVYLGPVSSRSMCNAAACIDTPPCGTCCNACWGTFTVRCGDRESVELIAVDETTFDEAVWEFSAENEGCTSLLLAHNDPAQFGGVGSECDMVWSPAPPEDFVEVRGRYQASPPALLVESVSTR